VSGKSHTIHGWDESEHLYIVFSYFISIYGHVSDETIQKYIEEQKGK